MRPYEGLLTAMVTPFRADGSVNEEAAVALGRHLLANGSHGLVVVRHDRRGGDDDRRGARSARRADRSRARRRGRRSSAGAGSNDTRHAVHLTEAAVEAGRGRGAVGHAVLQQAEPARASSRHFEEVARAAGGTPVILYNIPGRTAVNMPPDLLAELAQIDGIEAVKQANADELQPIDGLAVLAGNDDIYAALPGHRRRRRHLRRLARRRHRDAAHVRRAGRARGDRRVAARRLRGAVHHRQPDAASRPR